MAYHPDNDILLRIGTLAEVCEVWHLDRKTVIWAYWRGEVAMRKSAGTWIVALPDMLVRFGNPPGQIRDDSKP